METVRNTGIELGRLVAMLAVVCIHAQPSGLDAGWYDWVNQLARFAVPFFFITMGYFAKIGVPGEKTARTALRLLGLYLIWFVAYASAFGLPNPSTAESWAFGGVGIHLWFLSSAAISLVLISALVRYFGAAGALLAGLIIYGAAVALNSYSTPLFGQDFAAFDTRNGFFFGAPFIAIGVVLSRIDIGVSAKVAAVFFAGYAAVALVEVWFLNANFGLVTASHDFVLSTLPFGLAAFLFFRSLDGTRIAAIAAPFGGLALGVYLIHPALIRVVGHFYAPQGPMAFLLYVSAIFGVSALAAYAIGRIPLLSLMISTSVADSRSSRPIPPRQTQPRRAGARQGATTRGRAPEVAYTPAGLSAQR